MAMHPSQVAASLTILFDGYVSMGAVGAISAAIPEGDDEQAGRIIWSGSAAEMVSRDYSR